MGPERPRNDEAAAEKNQMEIEGLYSVQEQLKGMEFTVTNLGRLGMLDGDIEKRLRGWNRALRLKKVSQMAQATIYDHSKCS